MPSPLPTSFFDEAALLSFLPSPAIYDDLRRSVFRQGVPWDQAMADHPGVPGEWREAVQPLLIPLGTQVEPASAKALFRTRDGWAVEAVLMRHRGRATLCLSCQAGCALGCAFCATGSLGLGRSLTAAEILEQAAWATGVLRAEGQRLRNVVFMGMGEPLLALEAVGPALEGLLDQRRFELAPRYVSLSTCGVTPAIGPFARAFPKVKLAVSLHAPRQDLRDKLMPGCRGWPLEGLLGALDDYQSFTGHRLFFEYIMISGVNDGAREAGELTGLLRGRDAHVNLIPLNPGTGPWRASDRPALDHFQHTLAEAGIPSTVRHSAGKTLGAACGQLAGKEPSGNSNGRASATVEAKRN